MQFCGAETTASLLVKGAILCCFSKSGLTHQAYQIILGLLLGLRNLALGESQPETNLQESGHTLDSF